MARKPNKASLEKRIEAIKAKLAAEEAALKAIADEEAKASSVNAARVIALSSALRTLVTALKNEYPDALPTEILDIQISKFPRDRTVGRRYGLSETEVHAAAEKGRKAVEGL